jgi:hypothetical protein
MICCTEINLLHDYPHISTKLRLTLCPSSFQSSKHYLKAALWYNITLCKFWGLHSGTADVSVLLGYHATSLGNWFLTLWENVAVSKCWQPIAHHMASCPIERILKKLWYLTLLQKSYNLYFKHSLYTCLQLAMCSAWSRTVNRCLYILIPKQSQKRSK